MIKTRKYKNFKIVFVSNRYKDGTERESSFVVKKGEHAILDGWFSKDLNNLSYQYKFNKKDRESIGLDFHAEEIILYKIWKLNHQFNKHE